MDFLINYWETIPRRYPAAFPISVIGSFEEKEKWVDCAFNSCNFSLILRGRGEFRRKGRIWPVEAPCVITQWPGEPVSYGPPEGETWAEVFFIYPRSLFRPLIRAGLIDPARPIWPIADPEAVRRPLLELSELMKGSDAAGIVDRVDRLCERVVLETHLMPKSGREPIAAALEEVRRAYREPIDFADLAARLGMSMPTFRRHWLRAVGVPPGRFQQALRMQEACRLLIETGRPVRDVAHELGYPDEFYFSRCFRQQIGVPPLAYRAANHLWAKGS